MLFSIIVYGSSIMTTSFLYCEVFNWNFILILSFSEAGLKKSNYHNNNQNITKYVPYFYKRSGQRGERSHVDDDSIHIIGNKSAGNYQTYSDK